jgi:lipopolysaccharide transport system ATP-binding protein
MSSPIISVDKVSKLYRLGKIGAGTMRDSVGNLWSRVCGSASITQPAHAAIDATDLWALQDVSFDVQQGEVLGLIGRNGAGKSTLLKVLSRITEPTSGRAVIRGRVASLLEVGTGFHPELTGRENVFLNGAILGMRKADVARKFDDIVEFAEVQRFIDTPVKRYSSGMYVRLAFAVAAHLEPEVLIVDEVLAVGDVDFQRKCLGRMKDVSEGGRTVLFVSHNLGAIRSLCSRTLVLERGRLRFEGKTEDALEDYMQSSSAEHSVELAMRTDRQGSGELRYTRCVMQNPDGSEVRSLVAGMPVVIRLSFRCQGMTAKVNPGIAISTRDGRRVSSIAGSLIGKAFSNLPDEGEFLFHINRIPFNLGEYSLLIDANSDGHILDRVEDAMRFHIERADFYETARCPSRDNVCLVDFDIRMEQAKSG